jgi:hypothetical protein
VSVSAEVVTENGQQEKPHDDSVEVVANVAYQCSEGVVRLSCLSTVTWNCRKIVDAELTSITRS